MIFHTNLFIPKWAAGCANGPLIFIRPKYKDDLGLLAHEKMHVWQWYRTFGVHSLLYLFSKKYKLAAEVEAYKEQAKHYTDDRSLRFAGFIARDYGLNISVEDAYKLLKAAD